MFLRVLLLLIITIAPILADTPKEIEDYFKKEYPKAQIRLDGLLQIGDKLWLPFVNGSNETGPATLVYKSKENDYLFSNGWIYVPMQDNTVRGFDYYDEKIQAQILLNQITPGFLIPKGFTLPRDLAITAGRLPIELRTVELASDREIKFKERLKQEQISNPLKFLSYSVKSGILSEVGFVKDDQQGHAHITKLEDLSANFSYVVNMKRIQSKIYFVDYTRGKVFALNEAKLEEIASLGDYGMKTGLQDFYLSDDFMTAYLLTNVDPKLLIVDLRTKKLIKAITVPPGSCDLTMISRNSSEPTQLYMISKSNSRLIIVNTFDYRISAEVDLNTSERLIPHALAVNASKVFIGVEAVEGRASEGKGRIIVLDAITNTFVSEIKLDYIPDELSFASEADTLYALGSSNSISYVSKINIEKMELLKTLNLSPDIQSPKGLALSRSGYLLLIASAGTNTIGVLDIASWELVYKIDIGDRSNILISL